MVDDSLPQWIRTYPEEAAPRTGDGLFPGEVIEVAQVQRRILRYPLVLCYCPFKRQSKVARLQKPFERKYSQLSSSVRLSQVLTNKEKVFLRVANDRGWTYAKNPSDDSTLFEEINGDIAEDK